MSGKRDTSVPNMLSQALSGLEGIAGCRANILHVRAATADGGIWSYEDGRWVKLNSWVNRHGYSMVSISGKKLMLHRLVAEAFHGKPNPSKPMARHLDDDKSNNCADNLAWGTAKDNTQDMFLNGKRMRAAERRTKADIPEMILASPLCPKGHFRSLENTSLKKTGAIRCKECDREAAKRTYWAAADRAEAAQRLGGR